ncbi:hypothetical protein [Neorickettsia risticii]|nr:hypothetical protein [Neorickettsia risticii]
MQSSHTLTSKALLGGVDILTSVSALLIQAHHHGDASLATQEGMVTAAKELVQRSQEGTGTARVLALGDVQQLYAGVINAAMKLEKSLRKSKPGCPLIPQQDAEEIRNIITQCCEQVGNAVNQLAPTLPKSGAALVSRMLGIHVQMLNSAMRSASNEDLKKVVTNAQETHRDITRIIYSGRLALAIDAELEADPRLDPGGNRTQRRHEICDSLQAVLASTTESVRNAIVTSRPEIFETPEADIGAPSTEKPGTSGSKIVKTQKAEPEETRGAAALPSPSTTLSAEGTSSMAEDLQGAQSQGTGTKPEAPQR